MSIRTELKFPKDEDFFEDLCLDLWRSIYKNGDFQRNGRRGQSQNGVDIYGYDENKNLIGIQCKKKDQLTNKKLTQSELEEEVKKAKKFNPPLNKYIVATSAVRDANIQEIARNLSKENLSNGLFSVHIYSWEEITYLLNDYQDLIKKHDLGVVIDNTPEKFDVITEEIKQLTIALELSKGTSINFSSNFEYVKKLIQEQKPDDALNFLDMMLNNDWNNATDLDKYEILKLKGIAYHKLLKNDKAGKLLIKAFSYNPNDEKAKINQAFGFLFLNELDNSKNIAKEILKLNESNIEAYQILIYSSSNEDLNEIINNIPSDYINDKGITYAIGILARQKELFEESENWLEIAVRYGSEDFYEAKANLGEVILTNIISRS